MKIAMVIAMVIGLCWSWTGFAWWVFNVDFHLAHRHCNWHTIALTDHTQCTFHCTVFHSLHLCQLKTGIGLQKCILSEIARFLCMCKNQPTDCCGRGVIRDSNKPLFSFLLLLLLLLLLGDACQQSVVFVLVGGRLPKIPTTMKQDRSHVFFST